LTPPRCRKYIASVIKRGASFLPGFPVPRQLVLDQGKDLNEFYNLSKGGNMKTPPPGAILPIKTAIFPI